MAADSADSDSSKATGPSPADDPTPSTPSADRSASDETPATEQPAAEQPAAEDQPSMSDQPESRSSRTHAADRSDTPDETPAHYGYPPALIATAIALPVVVIVGLLFAAIMSRTIPAEREPLALGPVPAPAADGPACTGLMPTLPATLGDYTKSQLVEPAPPATRAWQRPDGGDAIVLRCGLDRPLEFNRASPLQLVNTVQWFEVRDPAASASTWFAVDRETYIALTVPDGSGPTPLQAISDAIVANLPPHPPTPGPLPN